MKGVSAHAQNVENAAVATFAQPALANPGFSPVFRRLVGFGGTDAAMDRQRAGCTMVKTRNFRANRPSTSANRWKTTKMTTKFSHLPAFMQEFFFVYRRKVVEFCGDSC
jgi:hypothetical protein